MLILNFWPGSVGVLEIRMNLSQVLTFQTQQLISTKLLSGQLLLKCTALLWSLAGSEAAARNWTCCSQSLVRKHHAQYP